MLKKIICFGGGTAVPNAILKELKKKPVIIKSIVSMLENGGSSGQLRTDFKTLPAGDVRRHLIALSSAPEWKKKLFVLRVGRELFDDGHKGHVFGNIFISGLEYICKDFAKALDIARRFLEIKKHRVLPATIEHSHIYAVLKSGEIIFGEDEIDIPVRHKENLKIKEVRLTKEVKAYPQALREIGDADLIVIGPGDLYSSLLPCFLPQGMSRALKETKARKVFVCNLMTKTGETENFSVKDFTDETEKYIGYPLDFVIYNTNFPSRKRIKEYKKSGSLTIELTKIDKDLDKKKFIGKNVVLDKGPVWHDPKKLVKVIMSLL